MKTKEQIEQLRIVADYYDEAMNAIAIVERLLHERGMDMKVIYELDENVMEGWADAHVELQDALDECEPHILTVDDAICVWYRSHEEDIMIAAERHTRDEFVGMIADNIHEYMEPNDLISPKVLDEAVKRIIHFCDECLIGQFKTN